jgi:PDDEXK-like domain of unknown function (DUF3799)
MIKTLTNEEYHSEPGISSSKLSLLNESVLHFEYSHLFNYSSDVFNFGSLVHTMILEPKEVSNRYAVMPKFDGRTNEGKAIKERFESELNGRVAIDREDFLAAEKMMTNTLTIAGDLFQNGESELSVFAVDNSLLIKCRPDYYRKDLALVLDVKTTSDISDHGINKSIKTYRYDWSCYFYPKVLRLAGLPAEDMLLVFVESQKPHRVKVRKIHDESLLKAGSEVEALLQKYRDYKLTGKADLFKTIGVY